MAAIGGVRLREGGVITCRSAIIATGGASYTGTGSTGDGCKMAADAGHSIIPSETSPGSH